MNRKAIPMITTRSALKVSPATVAATAVILITAAAALLTPHASADPKSISGSLDGWEGAVCTRGSVITGGTKIFRNSVAGDSCQATNRAGPIIVGQWDDNYLMLNDITLFQGGSYVSAKSGQTITDLVSPARGGAALQPLTQFGFVVNPIPARGQ